MNLWQKPPKPTFPFMRQNLLLNMTFKAADELARWTRCVHAERGTTLSLDHLEFTDTNLACSICATRAEWCARNSRRSRHSLQFHTFQLELNVGVTRCGENQPALSSSVFSGAQPWNKNLINSDLRQTMTAFPGGCCFSSSSPAFCSEILWGLPNNPHASKTNTTGVWIEPSLDLNGLFYSESLIWNHTP